MGTRVKARAIEMASALAPGLVGFLAVVGVRALDPTNVGWIRTPDPLKDYLGWAFFRHAPWGLPLGANPSFGLDRFGSSVFYSDSIPLLALGLKPFGAVLPEPFQYLGLWLLACFLLQSYFAWRLLGTVAGSAGVRAIGALLFVFAPPMLMRVDLHHALVGQWLLLAALLFNVSPPRRPVLTWTALATVSALVHPYLFLMVIALWIPTWVPGWISGKERARDVAPGLVAVFGCSLLALWQAGAFVVGGGLVTRGFGYYRMNLLALVNPLGVDSQWSYLLPPVGSASGGEYEGFNFLGLGGLLCGLIALSLALRPTHARPPGWTRRWVPLGIVCAGLTLLAVSDQVGLGPWTIAGPLPATPVLLAAVRASGRFFWPVFYLILFVAVAGVARSMRPARAMLVLGVLAAAQVIDTSAGWRGLHERMNVPAAHAVPTGLRDRFWTDAARVYGSVRVVPFDPDHWNVFAAYAAEHRMSTDSVYLTRVDFDRITSVDARLGEEIARAEFSPTTLYVVSAGLAAAASAHVDPAVDLVARIDGFWVIAPRWQLAGRRADR